MNIVSTEIPDVLIVEPKVFGDSRGFFFVHLTSPRRLQSCHNFGLGLGNR